MSATLDAQPISDFLNHAPILTTEARTHPIQILYRSPRDLPLEDHIANITQEALTHDGDILIFLPGRGEIDRTLQALHRSSFTVQHFSLLPLHSTLSSDEQQRALRPDPDGKRKSSSPPTSPRPPLPSTASAPSSTPASRESPPSTPTVAWTA